MERLTDPNGMRESNGLVLTGNDLASGPIRPHVINWLKRLFLDLGYYNFEDILERWRA